MRLPWQQDTIILRNISRDEAKTEVVQLYESGDVLDHGDIADRLRLDLPLVTVILRELVAEGVIEAC